MLHAPLNLGDDRAGRGVVGALVGSYIRVGCRQPHACRERECELSRIGPKLCSAMEEVI